MGLSYAEVKQIKEIAMSFQIVEGEITHVIQVNSGRINTSYNITVTQPNDTVSYMLQKINSFVFSNEEDIMNNALLVTEHLRKKGIETLEFIPTKDGKGYTYYSRCNDLNLCGRFRMTKFIHAEIFQSITRPEDMYNLGCAVGTFALGLSDFDAEKLVDTIPNFHNTVARYENLLVSALDNTLRGRNNRVKEAEKEIEFIKEHRELYGVIGEAITHGEIPLRVTHNDTKLNNVLFDRKTNKPRCMIDLDTVMKGSVLYDIADAIRSGANTSSEEERKLLNIRVDLELVRQFLVGYRDSTESISLMLTRKEVELLPVAIQVMPIELGMRYLTDYFDGDKYFGIVNPDDNLNRAKVQLALAREIEKNKEEIEKIISEIF